MPKPTLYDHIQNLEPFQHHVSEDVAGAILGSLWPAHQFRYIFRDIMDASGPNALGISFTLREIYTSHGIWGIPCQEAIEDIIKAVKNSPEQPQNAVLEVMGGNGYLSYWLQILGNLDVICTDLQVQDDNWKTCSTKQWTFVESMAASEAVLAYPGRTVLASWIPYGGCKGNDDEKMLKNMTSGQQLIFIGEWEGGCCASDEFFEILKADFEECGEGRWVSAMGIHDYMWFFRKK